MGLKALVARTLLKLPDGTLVRLSGGAPLTIDGRTLDARAQFLAARAKSQPPLRQLTVAQVRAGMDEAAAIAQGWPPPSAACRDLEAPGAACPLRARLHEPPGGGAAGAAPLLVYFHQGGGVIGALEHCHAWCGLLAATACCRVLSVDYRLAPEHPHPAAVEDAIAVHRWAVARADLLKHDGRVAVGGDSIGGYLSAALCQAMRRTGGPQPALQLLLYPATDLMAQGGSLESMKDAWPLSGEMIGWFMEKYFGPKGPTSEDPYLRPLATPDLQGLAPALVYTAGFDPLRDQGAAYARRLKEAGVSVAYREYPSLCHAFTLLSGVIPAAAAALAEIAADVRAALR